MGYDLFTEFEIYIKSHLISRTKMNQKEANAKYIDLIYRIQTGQELRKAGVNIFGKSVNSSRTAFSDTKNSTNMFDV